MLSSVWQTIFCFLLYLLYVFVFSGRYCIFQDTGYLILRQMKNLHHTCNFLLKTDRKFLQCVLLDEARSTLKELRKNVLLVLSLLDFSILFRFLGLPKVHNLTFKLLELV